MVNDLTTTTLASSDQSCALFFVKPPQCAALADCIEPAVWCWHESCQYPVVTAPCFVDESVNYYCSCSSVAPLLMVSTTTSVSRSSPQTGQLPVGAIAAIAVLSILIVVSLVVLTVWLVLKYKQRRKLEGRYCPAVEEEKGAVKNLPPLPPPSIEGLI